MLLRELACAGNVADATLSAQATPLLHALTAAHAYIMMFVHTCRVGQVRIILKSVRYLGHIPGILVCLEAVLLRLVAIKEQFKGEEFFWVGHLSLRFRLLSRFTFP